MWRSSGSTPSPSRMAELLTLSLRECHPMEEAHFSRLYPVSRSFGHDHRCQCEELEDGQEGGFQTGTQEKRLGKIQVCFSRENFTLGERRTKKLRFPAA
ncbi:hypothetical protein AMECASPLE_020718 [Ameca splendens]|uniref:Uncharacterized protein n=1 Tax=Ameca splendens TaxID=208324 RepID=A0ABV0YQ90_9TELE